jgi:hypothetical protein
MQPRPAFTSIVLDTVEFLRPFAANPIFATSMSGVPRLCALLHHCSHDVPPLLRPHQARATAEAVSRKRIINMLKVLAAATESFLSKARCSFARALIRHTVVDPGLGACFHLHPVHDQALVSVIMSSIRLLSVHSTRCSIAERLGSVTAIVEFLY